MLEMGKLMAQAQARSVMKKEEERKFISSNAFVMPKMKM